MPKVYVLGVIGFDCPFVKLADTEFESTAVMVKDEAVAVPPVIVPTFRVNDDCSNDDCLKVTLSSAAPDTVEKPLTTPPELAAAKKEPPPEKEVTPAKKPVDGEPIGGAGAITSRLVAEFHVTEEQYNRILPKTGQLVVNPPIPVNT